MISILRKIYGPIFGLLLVVFPAFSADVTNNDVVQVTKVAKEFCSAELLGEVEKRRALLRFSPTRLRIEAKEKSPLLPGTLLLDIDSVTVIDNFRLTGVDIKHRSDATILVEYSQIGFLGKFHDGKKIERNLISTRKVIAVELRLKKFDDQWYVFDPDGAKVGVEKLISYYDEKIRLFEESHKGEMHPRLQAVDAFQRNMLDSLRKL
jgi:hypothetical protein